MTRHGHRVIPAMTEARVQNAAIDETMLELRRQSAWNRYANYPHADINVGWDRYLAELREIDALAGEQTPRLSKAETRRIKQQLVERDGPDCWLCGEATTPFDRTVEHLVAVSRGGTNDLENLALAHTGCNRRMGNLSLADKLAMREAPGKAVV